MTKSLSDSDRRKRRKLSKNMSSLPSPPDLKLSISPPSLLSSKSNTIIHDFDYCMFRIELDKKGNTGKKKTGTKYNDE